MSFYCGVSVHCYKVQCITLKSPNWGHIVWKLRCAGLPYADEYVYASLNKPCLQKKIKGVLVRMSVVASMSAKTDGAHKKRHKSCDRWLS